MAATGVLRELQTSFNVIWKVRDRGVSVLTLTKQFMLCLAVILAMGLLLAVSLALGAAVAAANARFNGDDVATAVRWMSTLVSFSAMTVILGMTFKLFPSANPRWSEVWIGAATTAALLELGKYAIGLYVVSVNGRSFYRAAGAILIILIWAYYSSQILLFGAELTKAIADWRRRRRSRRRR